MTTELVTAIDEAFEMAPSFAQVEALELLVRQAEQRNDASAAAYGARLLYYAAFKMMLGDRMVAAYTSLRATHERHASTLPAETALHVASLGANLLHVLDKIPEISWERMNALYSDIEKLHVANGLSRYGLCSARVSSYFQAGYTERARAGYEELLAMPADKDACEPCSVGRHVWFLLELERVDEAIELAAPLTDGRLACDNYPAGIWSMLAIPLARRGDWKLARAYHARLHRSALARPTWVGNAAAAATFAAIDRAHIKAKNVLAQALPHAMQDTMKGTRFEFFTAVTVWLDAVAREQSSVKLALPKELPLEHASSRYEIAPLRAWFANAAHEIASQFDRRNGNTHWTDELGSASDVLELEPPPR